ncbi:MAG TPA: 8-oxoguanine deaminase [Phycisphaerae bacterium]|nr:8-oxoguanine deaminase [Phycisphaerae bacterium]
MKIVHETTVITPSGHALHTLHNHSLVFDDCRVVALGSATDIQPRVDAGEFDEIIIGDRHVVIPGLVNTHHHLYQSLTRCLPTAQNERLFDWLLNLYDRWRYLDYEAVNIAAKVSIAELLLHGCTTTSDHFYMFPRGGDVKMEAVLAAAEELGIRLHLCRGAMTLGQSRGGLPPDDCVEDDADVLADCQRVLDAYHDPSDYALRRIDLAPCSPFNCTREVLRDAVMLARERDNVLLHTHLAETLDEERYCLERYNCRPLQFLADLDFLGPDVYLAHCVHLNDGEIGLLAKTSTGVSHNPSSNLRLGSGIAPIRKLLAAGVRVGLGVDGSSSNDGGNLLGEARQALLAARAAGAMPGAMPKSAEAGRGHASDDVGQLFPVADAFKLATVGGAACLNRPVLGHLNPGAAADFAMFRVDDIALAGAIAQDPMAALILCAAPRADRVYIAGREVVHDGRITALDEGRLAGQLNELVAARFRGD